MRKVSFFIIFFQMLTVPLFAGGWYSVNIDLKTTAAMTAAYAAETATEMMNGEDVQKILDHYTNARFLQQVSLHRSGSTGRLFRMPDSSVMPRRTSIISVSIRWLVLR